MKKYSSGSFIDAAVRVYGSEADTITSFPASIIANGGNITPWAVYGNTVEGASVGEKTVNMYNKNNVTDERDLSSSTGNLVNGPTKCVSEFIEISENTSYTTHNVTTYVLYNASKEYLTGLNIETGGIRDVTIDNTDAKYIRIACNMADKSTAMLNAGSTALPYEPYGYKLTVVIGSNTTNIYMADVLRMSSGADPVYDIMSSTGVITRNVDTDGTPLITPTTESFTAPTIATVAGSQSVSFDTTVKPSKAELTYTGWHTHDDKKRSGGAWV